MTPRSVRNLRSAGSPVLEWPICKCCADGIRAKRAPVGYKHVKNRRAAVAAEAIAHAVKRDDFEGFCQAIEDIDFDLRTVESDIHSLINRVQIKTGIRNRLVKLRDEAYMKMRQSPNASYFIRRYDANKHIAKHEVRQAVFSKDGHKCVRCGATKPLSVDHIVPVVMGGSDDLSNLQTLCRRCNSIKGARAVKTATENSGTIVRWSN